MESAARRPYYHGFIGTPNRAVSALGESTPFAGLFRSGTPGAGSLGLGFLAQAVALPPPLCPQISAASGLW